MLDDLVFAQDLFEAHRDLKNKLGSDMSYSDAKGILNVMTDKRYYFGQGFEALKYDITPEFLVRVANDIYLECKASKNFVSKESMLTATKEHLKESRDIKDLLSEGLIAVDLQAATRDFFDDVEKPVSTYIKWDDEKVEQYARFSNEYGTHKYHELDNGKYLSARNIAWNEDRDLTIAKVFVQMHPEVLKLVEEHNKEKLETMLSEKPVSMAKQLSLDIQGEKFDYSKSKTKNPTIRT